MADIDDFLDDLDAAERTLLAYLLTRPRPGALPLTSRSQVGAARVALRINRVRAVAANDAGFSDLLTALPDGAGPCLCCRRHSPDSPALILVADESDDDPRVLYAAVCSMCSTAYPADQLLADWVERVVVRYGGTAVPDHRFERADRADGGAGAEDDARSRDPVVLDDRLHHADGQCHRTVLQASALNKILVAALALLVLAPEVSAQNAITQEGTTVKDAPVMLKGNNRARQGATVNGAPTGQIVTTGDAVVGGRCDYSAPTDAADGYYRLCLDAKTGTIKLDGTKLPQMGTLKIEINGQAYDVPSSVAIVGSDAAVTSNATLKTVTGATGKQLVCLGFLTPGDGGLATYNWSPTNCVNADEGAQVQPTGVTGCWIADFASREIDLRVWGQACGMATDAKPAMQAAATYLQRSGGGSLKVSCPARLDSTVTLGPATRLTSSLPVYYPGQTDIPGPSVWPPASGNAINCYSTSAPCIVINGEGVEIDHINFGNPQVPPPASGTWAPTLYPFVLSTSGTTSWQGLNIHDVSFTATSQAIDLEGTANYAVYAGSQIKIDHIWCNPCTDIGIRIQRIDNTLRISNFESTPAWYFNVASIGAYLRNHAVGFDIKYVAAPFFDNIQFFAQKSGIQITDGTVTNNFGSLRIGLSAGRATNIFFNEVCQAITTPNGNPTNLELSIVNGYFWGDESGFNCSAGKAMIDVPSNQARIQITNSDVAYIDTFINAGCGQGCTPGGGAIIRLSDIDVYEYSHFSAGQPFIKATAGSAVSFGTTNMAGIRPKAGAGKIMGPGIDGTQAYMTPISVGGGTNATEGAAMLQGSGNMLGSGFVSFFNANNQKTGFIGGCTLGGVSAGCQAAVEAGSFFIKPNIATPGSPVVQFGSSGANNIINLRPLPTSCAGLALGTLWVDSANANVLKVCP